MFSEVISQLRAVCLKRFRRITFKCSWVMGNDNEAKVTKYDLCLMKSFT